jgi:hypothetical protein
MIFHILKKDARRLWPAIAVSLAVLASLAWRDRWRADFVPTEVEGYLNLLMPLVWAALLGLAVEQESMADDSQFWLTRPYRPAALLGAKLLFAALFVHLPSLLADGYILSARGFPPLQHAGPLLMKQLALAAALTLPALALASLVRSFSYFMLELGAVAAAVLVLSGMIGVDLASFSWEPFLAVRRQALVLAVALASGVILYLQYGARRVMVARLLAAGAAAGMALLFYLISPAAAFAVRAALHPAGAAPTLQFDSAPRGGETPPGRNLMVRLPITLTGAPDGARWQATALRSEITAPGGLRYHEELGPRRGPLETRPYLLYVSTGRVAESPREWMTLVFQPAAFAGLAGLPVTVRGEAGLRMVRPGQSTSMGVGETREIAGVGRCTTSLVEARLGDEMIKLECESPRRDPYQTQARLTLEGAPREWVRTLGDSRTITTGPTVTWLSPLHRDQTFWHLASGPQGAGDHWLVPRQLARAARLEITPQEVVGYAMAPYEFRDLQLRR